MTESDSARVYCNLLQLDQRGDTGGEPLYTVLPRPATSTREQCRSWRRYIIPITISLVTAAICLSMSSYNLSKLKNRALVASSTLLPQTVRCPIGWILNPFSKTCLQASREARNWTAAKEYCESLENTKLATFETFESASWFQQQRNNNDPAWRNKQNLWIGGRYENGSWRWFGRITGPILYSFWGPGEPNNLGVEICIDTNHDFSWNNNNCNASYPEPLCERGPV